MLNIGSTRLLLTLRVPDVGLLRLDVAFVVIEGGRVGHLQRVRVLCTMQSVYPLNQLAVDASLGRHRVPRSLL